MEVRKAEPASPCRRRQFKYFLDLPGELRNKIYDFALFEPNGVYLDQPVLPELPWKRSINGSVLRVNRQIAAEATPRLYAINTFHLRSITWPMPLRSSELEDTDSEPEPEPEPQVPRRRRVSFRQETTEWFFHPVLQPKSTVMMFWCRMIGSNTTFVRRIEYEVGIKRELHLHETLRLLCQLRDVLPNLQRLIIWLNRNRDQKRYNANGMLRTDDERSWIDDKRNWMDSSLVVKGMEQGLKAVFGDMEHIRVELIHIPDKLIHG